MRAKSARPARGRALSRDEGVAVGVWVATNLWDGADDVDPDHIPIRVRVTTEDGTGSAYLTVVEAYELVQLLGEAITKAKRITP